MSSTNRGGNRIDQDNYPTPKYVIKALTDRIDFTKVNTFLEPCSGDDRILDFIPNHVNIFTTELRRGQDYFEHQFDVDLIVTNPPFSLSVPFLAKSLKEAKTVCYLQRINWLGSQIRIDFWKENVPDKLFVLSKRPNFTREYLKTIYGEDVNLKKMAEELGLSLGTDSTEYAWFIWDKLGIVNGRNIEVV